MSIQEYKFSDSSLLEHNYTDERIFLYSESGDEVWLNKKDSQAIAAHFNHDSVSAIKELIEAYNLASENEGLKPLTRGIIKEIVADLKNLINPTNEGVKDEC